MAREDGLAGRAGERKRTREGGLEEIFLLNHSLPFNHLHSSGLISLVRNKFFVLNAKAWIFLVIIITVELSLSLKKGTDQRIPQQFGMLLKSRNIPQRSENGQAGKIAEIGKIPNRSGKSVGFYERFQV